MENYTYNPNQDTPKAGPIIGIIIIIVVLLAGALYFWGKVADTTNRDNLTPENITAGAAAEIASLKSQGTTDDLTTINEDLQATDLTGLDKEITDLNIELNNLK